MFVQVIKGQVSDAAEVQAAWNRWLDEIAPGAIGWLGTTAGVTDEGTFVGLARFDSEDAARRNSERPEQEATSGPTSSVASRPCTVMVATRPRCTSPPRRRPARANRRSRRLT
jgi:hypothetical protein